MKRPKLKKASKRMSCAKRYKIQKKVREHHKKQRKEAKKKGVKKRVKKDAGVPSSAPFKEEVLREAEQRRIQIEEEKEKRKQANKQERAEKRKKDAADTETGPASKKAKKEDGAKKKAEKSVERSSEHFLCAELNKVIDASDVVMELLDARDPLGYRCPQLEEAVLQRPGNKKLILVLTKIDLVPKETLSQWIQCLQQELPVVAFKASANAQRQPNKKSSAPPELSHPDNLKPPSQGASCLADILSGYATATKGEDSLTVGVVGFPNVGKSSLINTLKGYLVCNSDVKKGTTKLMQEVQVRNNVRMVDSPPIVAAPTNSPMTLALRGLRVEEGRVSLAEVVDDLLKHCDSEKIMLCYKIAKFQNTAEFLKLLAVKRSHLLKGGVPNTNQAAETFLSDWIGCKLSHHVDVTPTYSRPEYLSDAAVAEMRAGWDLSRLEACNTGTLKGTTPRNQAGSVVLSSTGPTAGLLSVCSEDKAAAASPERSAEAKDEPEPSEQMSDAQEEAVEEPQSTEPQPDPAPAEIQPVPADLGNASTAQTDDAYDFNTDFQ